MFGIRKLLVLYLFLYRFCRFYGKAKLAHFMFGKVCVSEKCKAQMVDRLIMSKR